MQPDDADPKGNLWIGCDMPTNVNEWDTQLRNRRLRCVRGCNEMDPDVVWSHNHQAHAARRSMGVFALESHSEYWHQIERARCDAGIQ